MTAPLQTLQSLVDAAVFICGREFDNKDVIAESLAPLVIYEVSRRYAADPKRRPLTLATHTLSVTDGVATLPPQVLTEYLEFGVLADSGDATFTKRWRYVSWLDFTRPMEDALGYFSVNTETGGGVDTFIHITEPDTTYTPGSGFTGSLTLTTPTAVTVPTAATNDLQAPQEIQQDIVLGLARALNGQWLTAEVGG